MPTPQEQPTLPEPTDTAGMESLRACFAILANETRLHVLHLLRDGERNVTELLESMENEYGEIMKQPALSHHLGLMRDAGFVSYWDDGKYNNYSLTPKGKSVEQTIAQLMRNDLPLPIGRNNAGYSNVALHGADRNGKESRDSRANPSQDSSLEPSSPNELPSAEQALGRLYDRPLIQMTRDERFELKCIIEGLAFKHAMTRDDVLRRFRIGKQFYDTQVLPLSGNAVVRSSPPKDTSVSSRCVGTTAREQTKGRSDPQNGKPVARTKPVSQRSATEQLALYDRIMTMGTEGVQLLEACDKCGISTTAFNMIDLHLIDLRRRAREEATK